MSQRGFTLIEVLVASAIFVGVMVIGVSSFSNVNHINDQIQMTRNLSQTGNFVMETLARDIRSATGVKDLSSGGFGVDFPFDFLDSSSIVTPSALSSSPRSTSMILTRKVGTSSCNAVSPIQHLYKLVADGQNSNLILKNGTCPEENSLLPAGIRILKQDLIFSGFGHQYNPGIQPYITIKFTLIDITAPNPEAPSAQMTFQTTVTSLVYSGQ